MHIALQTTLSVVAELRGGEALRNSLTHGLDIIIVGGNDFYSQRSKVCVVHIGGSIRGVDFIAIDVLRS